MKLQTKIASLTLAIASFSAIAVSSPTQAQERGRGQANAQCVMNLGDHNRYTGPCIFKQSGGNGSFTVRSPWGTFFGGEGIQVNIQSNGVAKMQLLDINGFHQEMDQLRRSSRDRACWESRANTTICVY